MKAIAVYLDTFDLIIKGYLNIIKTVSKIVDLLTVLLAKDSEKIMKIL